ncbi:helix-turn-helix domain-containing protein [Halobaculum sp. MBLA0143]|uniref:helix-turn-helix domain-containing protein n=1 Tax=Halobaculum sp. MBLA0143 TaxID=3079933 RepID=UPI003523A851
MSDTPSGDAGDGRRFERRQESDPETVSEILSVLGDEVSRAALAEADGSPIGVGRVVDTTDVSRSTVYRRLDRLVSLGLVREVSAPAASHSRTQYVSDLRAASVEFRDGGATVVLWYGEAAPLDAPVDDDVNVRVEDDGDDTVEFTLQVPSDRFSGDTQ